LRKLFETVVARCMKEGIVGGEAFAIDASIITADAHRRRGAYSDNYLIDLQHAVIMDVEATTAIRQAEVGAAKAMLDRTAEQFDVTPSRLVADGGYGSAEMVGWLVDERGIEPHVKLIDKSERTDGALSRSDFVCDPEGNRYVCPGGILLAATAQNLRKLAKPIPVHAPIFAA
jgi:hypothetical protein